MGGSWWLVLAALGVQGPREAVPVNAWEFRVEGSAEDAWEKVGEFPADFERMAGIGFDGVGLYRTTVEGGVAGGERAYLKFDAVATEATVTVGGVEVGRHLGGWTPFRCDVTDQLRGADGPVEVLVRVDEKVGHNTQGFLPIVEPHFGGIWQGVRLTRVPEVHFDDLRVLAYGDLPSGRLLIEAPIVGAASARVGLSTRRMGDEEWSVEAEGKATNGVLRAELPVAGAEEWSPERPALYEVKLRLIEGGDEVIERAAFRSIEAKGKGLRLNGKPLQVRGLLNWGYYPPGLAPVVDEKRFREDVKLAKGLGFNLMKFCLWVPPRRYLELCDEMGMLAWLEYPTWHPRLDEEHRADLLKEFDEFFAFDRNHPSVILRSLTCETGTSSDLGVIRGLYDRCKAMVPGAIVEDDSSWIEWQRVFDFYDDHPYGNNHVWVATLTRLNSYISEHGPKPLVLGEAIAADTWPSVVEGKGIDGAGEKHWLPGFHGAARDWAERMKRLHGPEGVEKLRERSEAYASAMRRFQVEVFRREVPEGGYVVSVIRDFPLAAMGLIGYDGKPKWGATRGLAESQKDTVVLLATEGDRRGFVAGSKEKAIARIDLSHFGERAGILRGVEVAVGDGARVGREIETRRVVNPGEVEREVESLDLSRRAPVEKPTKEGVGLAVVMDRGAGNESFEQSWDVWFVPEPKQMEVRLHGSVDEATAALFENAKPLDDRPEGPPIVARKFDERLIGLLKAGARVLMMPDGERGSFATANHWFLRGGPYLPDHPLGKVVPTEFLADLQAFDLAGPVLPRIDSHLEEIDPVMLLWDDHDLKEVRTHGLAFETKVGGGRLFVSALAHGPAGNGAGRWLLGEFVDHLANGPEPRRGLTEETIARLEARVKDRSIDLSEKPWRFRPDPENTGLEKGWQKAGEPSGEGWSDLRIDAHWEGQGFETLDGWAWYRTAVDVPADWEGEDIYLSFRGVDDAYEVYADGEIVGKGGDIENKVTAFEERVSHRVTGIARPGKTLHVAVRVFDWYGAGGLFRPVSLSTAEIGPEGDWVR